MQNNHVVLNNNLYLTFQTKYWTIYYKQGINYTKLQEDKYTKYLKIHTINREYTGKVIADLPEYLFKHSILYVTGYMKNGILQNVKLSVQTETETIISDTIINESIYNIFVDKWRPYGEFI